MLSTLITSKVRHALLVLFITHPDERFYLKQLTRDLGLSSSQLQKELAKLREIGFLTSSRESNTRYYQANKAFPLFPELKSMIYKTAGLADFLRETLEDIGPIDVALIYGSVAKNVEDMRSDVDLLVIGDIDLDALHDAIGSAEKSIEREINPTVFSRKDWSARIKKKQAFAIDILSGPKIVLIGDEDELRRTP
jgi:predicted nucleotidyltransferase